MPSAQEVIAALQSPRLPASDDVLAKQDLSLSANTPGEKSVVAEIGPLDRPLFLRPDKPLRFALVAHFQDTTNDTADDTETFTLGHELIETNATPQDFVLYEGDQRVEPDSVDYQNNSFTYTDDGTNNRLHAYYAVGTQAEVEFRKVANNGTRDTIASVDSSLLMRRDQSKDPFTLDLLDLLTGVVPPKWRLQVLVDAPFQVQFADDQDPGAEAINAVISIPTRRADQTVPGLRRVVRQHASQR